MKKALLFLIVLCTFSQTHAQFVYKIKADSVLITNDSCTAELNLENSTKNVKGFLYNKGNGRTEFRKVVKLNDSTFIFGADTLLIGSRAAWSLNGNAGTNPATNFIGTADNQAVVIRTNNTEKMRIAANGFVGIGANSPAAPLQIIDTFQSHGDVVVGITTNTNTYSRIQINDINPGISAGAGLLMRNNLDQGFQLYMGSSNNAFVPAGALLRTNGAGGMAIVSDSGPIAFGKDAHIGTNEFARFLNNGNLGIGTQTPAKRLHVIGQGLFSDTVTAQKNVTVAGNIDITQGVINMTTTGISPHININGNQDGWPRIVITNVANTASAGAGTLFVNNAGQSLQQYMGSATNAFVPEGALIRSNGAGGMAIVADSGPIAFGKDPHIGINEFARFLNNGNLGIGTQTPAYKLDVNGKLGVHTIDSTATAANMIYQDPATGEIKKTAVQPYKKYVALISQSAGGDPTAIVLENTLGGTVTWARNITGLYIGTLTGAFTQNKTWFSSEASDPAGNVVVTKLLWGNSNSITLVVKDGTLSNMDGWTNLSVEIRVYP